MKIRNQKGQTSVEYILLLAVVIAIMSNLLPRIQEYLILNPERLQGTIFANFGQSLQSLNSENNDFRYFRLRR